MRFSELKEEWGKNDKFFFLNLNQINSNLTHATLLNMLNDPNQPWTEITDIDTFANQNGLSPAELKFVKNYATSRIRNFLFKKEKKLISRDLPSKRIHTFLDSSKIWIYDLRNPSQGWFQTDDIYKWAEERKIEPVWVYKILNNEKNYRSVYNYRFSYDPDQEQLTNYKRSKLRGSTSILDPANVWIFDLRQPKKGWFKTNNLVSFSESNNIQYYMIDNVIKSQNRSDSQNQSNYARYKVKNFFFTLNPSELKVSSRDLGKYVSTIFEPEKEVYVEDIKEWAQKHNIKILYIRDFLVSKNKTVPIGIYRFRNVNQVVNNQPLPPPATNPLKDFKGFNINDEADMGFWYSLNRRRLHDLGWGKSQHRSPLEATDVECWNIFTKQDKKCALTGKSFDFNNKLSENYIQYDQKNPKAGYTKDNLQFLRKCINRAKYNLNVEEFVSLCKKIVNKEQLYNKNSLLEKWNKLYARKLGEMAMPPKIPNDKVKEMAKFYISGDTISELSRAYGFGEKIIRKSFLRVFGKEQFDELEQQHLAITNSPKRNSIYQAAKNLPNFNMNNIVHRYWYSNFLKLRKRNEKYDIPTELSLIDAWDIFYNQHGKCAYSGIEFRINPNWEKVQDARRKRETLNKKREFLGGKYAPSPDRIDSSIGYTKDNLAYICQVINLGKVDLPRDKYFELCKEVVDYVGNKY